MKIKSFIMSNGELYAALLDERGIPLPYQNLFITKYYRNQGKASNTCLAAFEHLKYLSEICIFLNIDLINRFSSGNFLNNSELELLGMYSRMTVHTFKLEANKKQLKKILSLKKNSQRIETARASIVHNDDKYDISLHTSYNRLTTFAAYIEWLEEYLFPSKKSQSYDLLKAMRPKDILNKNNFDPNNFRSLTTDQIKSIISIINPNSQLNPWKTEEIRYRNQLIVLMFYHLGCRRGELLRIKVATDNNESDIKKNSSGITVLTIRSGIDTNDTRKARPQNKTLGREIPMSQSLTELYENYLIHYRSKGYYTEYIPYLFITHNYKTKRNSALSLATINKIFREISDVAGFKVDPHSLRHTWNDRFSAHADLRIAKNQTTEAKSESDRRKLMGWSHNSTQAQHYAKRHNTRRAIEIGLQLQNSSDNNT